MSRSGRCKEIWNFAPILEDYRTQGVKAKCIAGQTKQVLYGLISNGLPLHFVFSSSQNSNVDNFLPDLHNPFKILCKILRTFNINNSQLAL